MNRQHLEQLKRPDLQTLAKMNNIRAGQKTDVLIDELLKIDVPNITGVKALEQVMGRAAVKKQKVMMRNGVCPRGPPRDKVMRIARPAAAPKRERTQRNKQSKNATGKAEAGEAAGAERSDDACASTSGEASSSQREERQEHPSGSRGSTSEKKRGQRSAKKQTQAQNTQVPAMTPAGKKAKDRARTEKTAEIKNEDETSGVANADDDLGEEEEVEAMTSLDNIIVDLASSPMRPGRTGKENKKRSAEDDDCDSQLSPRPAKRARTSSVL